MPRIDDPLMLEVPEVFETERLILRCHQPELAQALNDAIRESHHELRAWLPWARELQTVEQTMAFIRTSIADYVMRRNFGYVMLHKSTAEVVGTVGVQVRNWDVPSFEMGYWTRTSAAGNGYMSEAVRFLTDYFVVQVGARRMLIRCDANNKGSAGVAKRCGYVYEGTHINFQRNVDGDLYDMEHYAFTAPDSPQ